MFVESLTLLPVERDRAREEVEEEEKEEGGEEESCVGLDIGKEEVTSLPSFSWRHNAQIPPWFFVYGCVMHCIPSPIS